MNYNKRGMFYSYETDKDGNRIGNNVFFGSMNVGSKLEKTRENVNKMLTDKECSITLTCKINEKYKQKIIEAFTITKPDGYIINYTDENGVDVEKILTIKHACMLVETFKEYERVVGRDINDNEKLIIVREFVIYHKI